MSDTLYAAQEDVAAEVPDPDQWDRLVAPLDRLCRAHEALQQERDAKICDRLSEDFPRHDRSYLIAAEAIRAPAPVRE